VQPPDAFFTADDGARLHYLEWEGAGPVVILLTGLRSPAHAFLDFAPLLAERFHVLAVTRRSHGRSAPAVSYDVASHAADVRALMDERGIERASLVGASFGGNEITAFATAYPERTKALVYLDAAFDFALRREFQRTHPVPVPVRGPTEDDLASVEAYVAYMRRPDVPPYLSGVWSPGTEAAIRETIEATPAGVRQRWAPEEYRRFHQASAEHPDYTRFKAPILAIFAIPDPEADRPHPEFQLSPDASPQLVAAARAWAQEEMAQLRRPSIDRLRRMRPDACIVEMPGAHHIVYGQYPERIARMVADFISTGRC